jgi:hypothetical protein
MTNNKQQTPVEWLWEIAYNRELTVEDWKQAKEMEKQKMIEFAQSYAVIHCMGDITKNADEYYNETYGGNK